MKIHSVTAAVALSLCAPISLAWGQAGDAPSPQPAQVSAPPTSMPAAAPGPRLTRIEAEQLAIQHNPHISVSQLLALAQHQVVRETRAAEYPTFNGSITGVEAQSGGRIASGALNSPRLLTHLGAGATLSQLITDFGRTGNLIASSKLREEAEKANAKATVEDIVLATDQAFYSALQAQALLQVAEQTVATRQATQGQITQLTRSNLRSTLDQSFAEVNLSQSRLLALDAQNNANAALASLDEVLGLDSLVRYALVDDIATAPPAPPPSAEPLIETALKQRPDLQALNYDQSAATKFARAEHDQKLPTLAALGTAGGSPIRDGRYYAYSWDGAIGVNMNIPIFNGHLYSAQTQEAEARARAAGEQSRGLRDRIVRDVRIAWIDANDAYQRRDVTAQLLDQSNQALGLAQTRYRLGLSSIVELSQAQLGQTQAAIANTNAQYQYKLALATLGYQTGSQP